MVGVRMSCVIDHTREPRLRVHACTRIFWHVRAGVYVTMSTMEETSSTRLRSNVKQRRQPLAVLQNKKT